jgi:multidrug efflux system outer membrane protein
MFSKRTLKAACLAALVPALVSACTLAPKYERPAPPLAPVWNAGPEATAQPGAAYQDWRQVVADQPTRRLIEIALASNRDLRIAVLKVEKAQAQHDIRRADLFPHIDANAGANMARTPATLSGTGFPVTSRAYSVGLGFSAFELDFFGRVRSLKNQALEQFLSTQAAAKSAELTIVAQVGQAYLSLAADREHLALAQEILDTEQSSYTVVKNRFERGIANELALSQAQTTVDTARVSVAGYQAQVTADENTLSLLLGIPVTQELAPAQRLADIAPLAAVPAGLPSEVLLRRPDVISAEHDLKAANANIGAARAMHFPIISLTGSFGTASNEINGLFKTGTQAWTFIPQISLPIFHAGAISAGVRSAEADRDIYVAQYEKAVQTAFKEVSDALALGASLGTQVEAQTSLAKATGRSYQLSTLRYDKGIDSFLTKLDSQRANANARQGLISARLSQQTTLLTLYKALGGGWNGEDEAEAAQLLRRNASAKDEKSVASMGR